MTTAAPLPAAEPIADPAATLAALRAEIDAVDDALLALLERRLDAARKVGLAKAAGRPGYLNLKPDREAAVLTRLLAQSRPETREIAHAIWREVMAFGLAMQGRIEVALWSGGAAAALARSTLARSARDRFGAAPTYRDCASPSQALDAALADNTVAVLALDGTGWWEALDGAYDQLWVFEAIGPGDCIEALAVGRIDPAALAAGQAVRLGPVGQAQGRALMTSATRALTLDPAVGRAVTADMRAEGVVGLIPPRGSA